MRFATDASRAFAGMRRSSSRRFARRQRAAIRLCPFALGSQAPSATLRSMRGRPCRRLLASEQGARRERGRRAHPAPAERIDLALIRERNARRCLVRAVLRTIAQGYAIAHVASSVAFWLRETGAPVRRRAGNAAVERIA